MTTKEMSLKWIGLTGGIATGKSTVADLFRQNGFAVIDADTIAHQALVASSPVFASLIAEFGSDIIDTHGNIDRGRLGEKIFKNPPARLKLDSLVHPFVRQQVAQQKQKLVQQGIKVAIYDVPLLFEKNMQKDFDKIVVVACRPDLQKARLIKRNSLTQDQAEQRISAQLPIDQKTKQADFVIENNSSLEELKNQTQKVISQLQKLS